MTTFLSKKTLLISLITILCLSFASALFADEALYAPSPTDHNRQWGFPHKEGIVLVLAGGGTKGLSHIGVLEVLERENIPIAAIVGTSMGSIMGGFYASGYTAAEMKEILNNVNLMEIISNRSGRSFSDVGNNKPPRSDNSMLSAYIDKKNKTIRTRLGILKTKDLYNFLSEATSQVNVTDFDRLPIPFAAIATDLENGETVVMRDGNLASAMRASLSIPGIFEPWEMNGRLLIDGGIKANLPVIEAKKIFPGHPIVAVNLSPKELRKDKAELRSVLEVAAQTLEILMRQQVIDNMKEADLVLSPNVSEFGVLDGDGYDEIIDRGRAAAQAHVSELHSLIDRHRMNYAQSVHSSEYVPEHDIVEELRFDGVPKGVAEKLYQKYDDWIGNPLDMKLIASAVKELSARDDFNSVEGKAVQLATNKVAVVFSIERPAKVEFGLDGYVGNINADSWLSLSAQVRDIMMDGDVGSLEYRIGNRWGLMGRYFTPLDTNNSQFGLVLSSREEGYAPRNASDAEFERHSARIAWYKEFNRHFRMGLGYAIEKIGGGDTNDGPYLSLNVNTLDDPLIPSRGVSLNSDMWLPIGETLQTRTFIQTHLPIWEKWKMVFSAGLKTGNINDPAYAAVLGNNEELYSLAKNPLVGDQAYWLHLGTGRIAIKSWWGGVDMEVFGRYGQVMRDWKNQDSWWEAGISLTVPMNNFAGKLVLVYDQGGDFTVGYSFGMPRWWGGPLP